MSRDTRDVPTDRGWAWMIVIGYFASIFCMAGIGKSFGIFMEEFVTHFDTSVAITSLIMGVYGGVYTVTAPFCVAAGTQFTQRKVVMVGGVLGAAGLCLSSLLLSIEWVIVVIGVLFGIGNSSIFGNGLVMINQYFDKRRSLANGLALSGASIGQFAIPPLLQFLLDRYSLQGALIIVGGVYLHVVVCGAIYRPLSSYRKTSGTNDLLMKGTNKRETTTGITHESIVSEATNTPHNNTLHSNEMDECLPPYSESDHKSNIDTLNEYESSYICHQNSNSLQITLEHLEESMTYNREPPGGLKEHVENMINMAEPTPYSEKEIGQFDQTNRMNEDTNSANNNNNGTCKSLRTFISSLLDFSALRGVVPVLFVIGSFLFFFGHFNFVLYMPPSAHRHGVSKYEKAYLVSINGLCDLLGRLSVGGLGDLKVLQRYKLFAITTFLCGVSILAFAFAKSFLMMGVCAGLYGLFGGGYVAINVPTLIDLVGQKRMPKVLAAVLFIQGIGAALGQPVLGALHDVTGSYFVVHMVTGLAMMLGSILLAMYPVFRRCEERP